MPDHESNALIWKGAAGADDWFALWLQWMRRRGYAYAFESPNEPQPMANATFRHNLDDFTVRLAHLFTVERLRLVAHNWSVGWPNLGHAPDFANSITALHNAGFFMGLHEYSAPAMWDTKGYHCLRYRRTVAELREVGVPIPKILIGETGIDGGVIQRPKTGWRDYATEDEYLAQLAWYDAELMRDDYILAATIFTVCGWDWHSFNVDESLAMKLADYIREHQTSDPEPPDPTPPEPDPTEPEPPEPAPLDSDAARWAELFEYLSRIETLLEARV